MATERTPLRTAGPTAGPGAYDQAPTYVFMTNPGRAHRNKIKQFQCCVCAAILGVFVMALIITISYSVEHDDADGPNATTPMPPIPVNDTLQLLLRSSWPRPDAATPSWPVPAPDEAALQRAVESGRAELVSRTVLESKMPPMQKDTAAYRANQAVHTRREATAMAQRALLEEKATKQLLKASGKKLSLKAGAGRGPRLHLAVGQDAAEAAACAEDELPLPCPASAYRSADGSCNNVQHPRSWGVAMRPFRRVMPPAYVDGVSEPRGLAQGLPSAREVSLGVHRPLYRNDPDFTVMLAVWGQFIDHDITNTALSQAGDGSAISCCDLAVADQHPECFPVRLAPGDPYYHKYNVTCMEFVRSAPAPTCSLGQREQLNQASSFLDASVVYGPTSELMRSLREEPATEAAAEDGDNKERRPVLGRLKMTMSPDGRELLPVSQDPNDGCNRQEMNDRGRYCFKSGDGRANENLHLTTMHLLLARQHNRVAAMLQSMNPHWNDERVFQESRRVVAAQMQHVTYNEFLPVILGPRLMQTMDLQPKAAGYDASYDADVDPTICNSFAASSFRFAHTLLPGLLKLIGNDTSSTEYMELHQMLFDPYSLYSREGADRALRGAMDTSVERADNYFNPELTQKLFAPRSIGRGSSGQPACGLDLVSLNVQRGRDHGLQPYPAWREHCGFPRPASWEDLDGVVDEDSLQRMKEIYKSVDDVDVYTGVLSEYPVEDGLLGGTLTCLLGDQFVRLKRGDRFWYETDQQPQAFTPAQLAEIRKTSLASIICGTSDGVHSAQPLVMRRVRADSNKRVPCAQLPRTNLRAWVERDGRYVYHRADALQATGHAPKDQDHVPDDLVLVGASPADKGLTATTARAVRVGGRVTGGSVSTASGTSLWSGSLPASIPVPALGAGAFLAGGVQWEGSLVSSGDTASLRGTFSVDKYTVQPGAPPPAAERVTGTFSVQMDVLWDSSSDGVLDLSGAFSSPVFLRAEGAGDAPLVSAKGGAGLMAPVILHGDRAADGGFLWNGNVTLVLPTMAAEEPADDALPPLLAASAYVAGPTKDARLVVDVQSGSITAQPDDGGAEVTWWDGDLPATIPTSLFDAREPAAAATEPAELVKPGARVDGVLWTAKVAASSPTTAQVSGTFRAPRFVHGNYSGAGVKVQWWSGSFALNVRLLGQPDGGLGLDSLLVPGQHYTSRLVFEADSPSKLDPASEPRAPLALLAAAQEVVDGALPAPVILKGAFSADRASFAWSGKAVLVLPQPAAMPAVKLLGTPMKSPSLKAPLRAPSAGEIKLAATVKAGKVTAGRDGSSEATLWSGAFPAAIPLPLFDAAGSAAATKAVGDAPMYAHGVVWQGALSASGTTLSLTGTFKAPRYLHAPDNQTFAMEWWKGSFSFELEPQWMSAASLDGVVSSTATYSSPVYFKALKESSTAAPGPQRTPLAAFVAASLEESEGAVRAPVILQGSYSADMTTFYWTGAVVLALPRVDDAAVAPPRPPLQLQAKPGKAVQKDDAKPSSPSKPSKPSKPVKPPKIRIAAMVLGGSVNGTYDNSTTVTELWSGAVPMWLPNPLFGVASWDLDQTIKWSGSLTALDKTGKTLQLDGTFEAPYFEQGADGVVEHKWTGTFSVQLQNLYSGVAQPELMKSNKVMKSRVVFAMPKTATGDSAAPQLTLQSEEGENLAVIVLQGQYWFWSKSWYWWNGMASVAVPLDDDVTVDPNQYVKPDYSNNKLKAAAPGAAPMAAPMAVTKAVSVAAAPAPAVRRIGIRVTSGNMYAYPEGAWFWRNWWAGSLPATIPVPIFDSYKSEYAPYPTGPLFHACGVDWTGTIRATSPTTVRIEGKFSMPNYRHGPGGVVITWYYGTFLFEGSLLWSANLDGLDALDGTSFSSHIYFKSQKPLPIAKYPVQSSATSLQQFVADTAALADGAVRIPVVLDGSYSADRTSFTWSGDAVITVPEPRPPLQLQAKPGKAVQKDDAKPSSPSKPSKPSKPVKPPKIRIAAMVLGGSVNASYDNSSVTELWSGAVPMWLPNPLFGVASWDLDQTIKWSGSLTALDKTGKTLQLDGSFEAPYFEQGADGVVEHKWTGTFSVQLQNLYSGVAQPELMKSNKVMKSRVVFAMPKTATGDSAAPQLTLQSEEGENLAVIVLQGQYWFWSKSWYWWNGMASVAVPLDDDVTVDPNQYVKPDYSNNKLKAAAPGAAAAKAMASTKLAVAVVDGTITAKKEGDAAPAATWWSGALPASIPASPFDGDATDASTPFNRSAVAPGGVARGVSWTGALRPLAGQDEAMLEGSFHFPRFLHAAPGGSFALEWWTGQFSLRLRALAGTSLSGALASTATYSSPLVFKAMSPDESILSLLQQPAEDAGVGFVMASAAKADGAAKLPVLLQGSYSPDGSAFLWTGNAILQVPAKAAKQQRTLKLTASSKAAKTAAAKSSSVSKIGAVVTSGTVSAGKAGQAATTVWSGTFPAALPTGAAGPASVLWSGALQQQGGATNAATLTGTFSTALPDDNGTLAWWSGDFSLQLQLLWNASLSGCIRPGVKYATPLYFRSASQPLQQAQQVAALGQEMESAGEKVLAFLDGSYSADKASFLWTGKVFLTLPKSCGKPTLNLKAAAGASTAAAAAPAARLTLGGVVASGWVTPSLWGGALPAAVPVAAIRGVRPLTWRGSLARGAAGYVTLKGSFSAPQYHHDAGAFSVDWITGDFSFTARLLWDSGAALDSALAASANYTSAIYLQNSDSLRALEDVEDRVPAVWDRMVDKVAGGVAPAGNKVPVVLQGEFADDGATFWWSGGVLIALPAAA